MNVLVNPRYVMKFFNSLFAILISEKKEKIAIITKIITNNEKKDIGNNPKGSWTGLLKGTKTQPNKGILKITFPCNTMLPGK